MKNLTGLSGKQIAAVAVISLAAGFLARRFL